MLRFFAETHTFTNWHDHTYLVPETMPIFSSKDVILMPWKGEPRSVSNLGVQKSILGSKKKTILGPKSVSILGFGGAFLTQSPSPIFVQNPSPFLDPPF